MRGNYGTAAGERERKRRKRRSDQNNSGGCTFSFYDVPNVREYRHSWYIRMAPMYECSIGPSSTLGFSKVFFGLLFFGGIFRYLLIENSGILVFWYFSCNFICWCVWYYWQNSYISATLCTKNDGTVYHFYQVGATSHHPV